MSTWTIAPTAYRLTIVQVLGAQHWYLNPYREGVGYSGPPSLSGTVSGDDVHTERLEEVLSYIANEIGATLG